MDVAARAARLLSRAGQLLLRALEVYEVHRLDFADVSLVAEAETSGVNAVASFDKTIERVPTVRRVEP
jgi:predicted nucleic acid-binding protein